MLNSKVTILVYKLETRYLFATQCLLLFSCNVFRPIYICLYRNCIYTFKGPSIYKVILPIHANITHEPEMQLYKGKAMLEIKFAVRLDILDKQNKKMFNKWFPEKWLLGK